MYWWSGKRLWQEDLCSIHRCAIQPISPYMYGHEGISVCASSNNIVKYIDVPQNPAGKVDVPADTEQ